MKRDCPLVDSDTIGIFKVVLLFLADCLFPGSVGKEFARCVYLIGWLTQVLLMVLVANLP